MEKARHVRVRNWGDRICLGDQKDLDDTVCPPKPTQILALRSPAFVRTFIREGGDSLKLCEMKTVCRSIRCPDSAALHCDVLVPFWSYRAWNSVFLSQIRVSYCLADGCVVWWEEQISCPLNSLLPQPTSQRGYPSPLPSVGTSLGHIGEEERENMTLVIDRWSAKWMDVPPSFQSRHGSWFILKKSRSGFRVSKEDPSGDFTAHRLRKGLNWQLL